MRMMAMERNQERGKEPEPSPDDGQVDWSEYSPPKEQESTTRPLDAKDYVALFIASLETIFLPLIILGLILVAIVLWVAVFL